MCGDNGKNGRFSEQEDGEFPASAQLVAGAKFSKNLLASRERRSILSLPLTHSSSGLGHRPFTAVTRVRIPYGSPRFQDYRELTKEFSATEVSKL
jgi:hypothetical protein